MYESSTEEQLVERAIAGDAEAFGELYRMYQQPIQRFIAARVSDAADSEEIASQVFLKAWEALPHYEQRGSRFASWLYQIARNLVIDHQRAQRPGRALPLNDQAEIASHQPGTLDQVIAAEQSAALASAVSQLPVEQRRVILLRFVRGLNHAEVARILDKSLVACRVIQHRALSTLSHILGNGFFLALILVLLFAGGTAFAANTALPGDLLYPVKRGTEAFQLAVSLSTSGDTRLHIAFSERRVAEIERLVTSGRLGNVPEAATSYAHELAAARTALDDSTAIPAGERGMLAAMVLATQADHATRLNQVLTTMPAEDTTSLEAALAAGRAAADSARLIVGGEPEPPPLVVPSPTPTPSPTPSATPSHTVTPRPTATRTHTATATATATATPMATRPRPTSPQPAPTVAATPTFAPPVAPPTGQPGNPHGTVPALLTALPETFTALPERTRDGPPDLPPELGATLTALPTELMPTLTALIERTPELPTEWPTFPPTAWPDPTVWSEATPGETATGTIAVDPGNIILTRTARAAQTP